VCPKTTLARSGKRREFTVAADNPRRAFFRGIVGETAAWIEELQGRPQLRMVDVPRLPDEALARVTPVMNSERGSFVHERDVYVAEPGDAKRWRRVKELTPDASRVAREFDGRRTIAELAEHLRSGASGSAISYEIAFATVKSVFLDLLRAGLCHPANADAPRRGAR
jgi:hypothetical protein